MHAVGIQISEMEPSNRAVLRLVQSEVPTPLPPLPPLVPGWDQRAVSEPVARASPTLPILGSPMVKPKAVGAAVEAEMEDMGGAIAHVWICEPEIESDMTMTRDTMI